MTTVDEAVAAAIEPKRYIREMRVPTIAEEEAAASRIRALSARVAEQAAEIDGPHGYKHQIATLHRCALEKSIAVNRAETAEAKLREIAEIADEALSAYGNHRFACRSGDPAAPCTCGLQEERGRLAALAHTATQPEATPGKGEG